MNFDFSDDEKLVQRAARDFLADRSPLTRVRELLESDAVFDRRLWRAIGEMGWLGTAVPERHGGSGSGHLELVLIAEEMGRALAAVPFTSSVLATEAVALAGSPDQQARLLPPLATGERIGTLVALEAIGRRGSYDTPPALQSGRLVGATLAAVDGAAADLGIVLAETDSGPALAVVDFHQAGVRRERLRSIDPTRSLALVSFDGAAAESLGPPGAGRETLARLLDRGAVLVAFEQLGGAQRCLEIAREYTMGRFAFGRPVASFQAIKHKLADMYVAVELARSNCYYGAWALATGGPELPTAAALARVSATEAFELCARESLQAHGGVGFTWEYDCHLFLKRSKLLASMLRPAFVWKDRLVELLEREAR